MALLVHRNTIRMRNNAETWRHLLNYYSNCKESETLCKILLVTSWYYNTVMYTCTYTINSHMICYFATFQHSWAFTRGMSRATLLYHVTSHCSSIQRARKGHISMYTKLSITSWSLNFTLGVSSWILIKVYTMYVCCIYFSVVHLRVMMFLIIF